MCTNSIIQGQNLTARLQYLSTLCQSQMDLGILHANLEYFY